MCRFIAYIGSPLIISDVLFKPKHSLIKQSVNALEMEEPLNGDGFGLGWYAQDINATPALFRSIQPAWNDLNLQYLAEKIRSNCFFAHIRSANVGGVSLANCHPFHYKELLFMHNGRIDDFKKIKRHIRRSLDDDIYDWVKGETDSEHFFAMFLNRLHQSKLVFNADNAAKILLETIHALEEIKKTHHLDAVSTLNVVITDGQCMVASRYVSSTKKNPNSLYYAVGHHDEFKNDNNDLEPSHHDADNTVLLVSERLATYQVDWHEVPANHILKVNSKRNIMLEEIKHG